MKFIKYLLTLLTIPMITICSAKPNYHLEFLPEKSDDILIHQIEKRGFVTVPLDYAHPEQQKLKIFYRLIPAEGHTADDGSVTTIVVVNGGPGMASRGYRAYDYDYSKKPDDKLSELTKHYRVLIMDQRGTPGNSSALKVNIPNVDYQAIAKYFSADSIARDQEAVINAAIGIDTPFYLISQSFGGMVGFQYMLQNKIKRKPAGVIFSSAAMPFEDALQFNLNRRLAQKELNLQLKKFEPEIENKIILLKRHFEEVGVDPIYVNTIWHELGHGKDGEWQQTIVDLIKKMQQMDKVAIEKYMDDNVGRPDLLNIILSSANMTPNYTDYSLSKIAMQQIPFAPWMLDEFTLNIVAAKGNSIEAKNIRRMDKQPPLPIAFGTPAIAKAAIHQSSVLFTFGGNDAMTPTQPGIDHMLANFYIPEQTKYLVLPGGHQAIFNAEGVKQLGDWIDNLS